MRINIKMLSTYLGCHRHTASKQYKMYLDLLGVKRTFLTVYDIHHIDGVPLETICKKMHIPLNHA